MPFYILGLEHRRRACPGLASPSSELVVLPGALPGGGYGLVRFTACLLPVLRCPALLTLLQLSLIEVGIAMKAYRNSTASYPWTF